MSSSDKKAAIISVVIAIVLFLIPIVLSILFSVFIIALIVFLFNAYTGMGVEVARYDKPIYNFEEQLFTTYSEYEYYFKDDGALTKKDFKKNNYYIFEVTRDKCSEKNFFLNGFSTSEKNNVLEDLKITLSYFPSCDSCGIEYMYYAVKIDKKIKDVEDAEIDYEPLYDSVCETDVYEKKPMIYLYPEEDMDVEVRLGNRNLLTTSYPKYLDSWEVLAHPDGTLEYDGREYYGLYWEGTKARSEIQEDGFVIRGEETSKFLEEKLEILGLNEREINEFIVYWLPKMEHNRYNYIRFETEEEIEDYMPLEITPEPDTIIRVYMQFKALDRYINVEEQVLTPSFREGFTVVEWGGSDNE